MRKAHRPGSSVAALCGALWMLAWCPCAFALNPSLDISQYAHTAWKIRDGFAKGNITAIAQTPDGYLWLGTEFGLLRFDGVRNVPWQPPPDQHLPSDYIFGLLAGRDGTLWIATQRGLASWKGGILTQHAALSEQVIYPLIEDREGTVWAGVIASRRGRLCAIRFGAVQCHGQDGSFGSGVFAIHEDRNGNLWVGGETGLWRWKPGPPEFYPMPGEPNGIQGLTEDDAGALVFVSYSGIKRIVNGKVEQYPFPDALGKLRVKTLFRDRD